MNETYLKASEGLEELKSITFTDIIINKRLALETFKIGPELTKDDKITSTFSEEEIKKLIYLSATCSLIQSKIKPLIEATFTNFSRSIKLSKNENEKRKYTLDFNDKIKKHYLFLSQKKCLTEHDISEVEIKLINNYIQLSSIIKNNDLDIFTLSEKFDEINKISDQEFLNNLKIYLPNVDYIEYLKVFIKQLLIASWTLTILDFKFLNDFYTISADLNGIPIFEKKKTEIKVKTLQKYTLFDLWVGNNNNYLNEIIIILTQEQHKFKDLIFISEIDGKLYWNKSLRNWNKYLAGFYRVLIEKKWVVNDKSAPQIVEILKETFNFENKIDSKNFRSGAMEIDNRFKEPFEFIEDK